MVQWVVLLPQSSSRRGSRVRATETRSGARLKGSTGAGAGQEGRFLQIEGTTGFRKFLASQVGVPLAVEWWVVCHMYNLVVMHDYILKFCMNSRAAGQYFTKF